MESNYAGKICPYCQQPIEDGVEVNICAGCESPHHQDCWNENGGCTTFGCRFAPQALAAPQTPSSVTSPIRIIAPTGTTGIVVCPYCRQGTSNTQTKCIQCEGQLYAGFWNRMWAQLFDGFILGALSYVLILISALISLPIIPFVKGEHGKVIGITMLVAMLLFPFIIWLYNALFESSAIMATPGKMLMAIKVTDEEGNRISFWRATGRNFATLLSYLLICIGFITSAFTPRKQALHDIISHTVVVRAIRPDREGHDMNTTRRLVVGIIMLVFCIGIILAGTFIFIMVKKSKG